MTKASNIVTDTEKAPRRTVSVLAKNLTTTIWSIVMTF